MRLGIALPLAAAVMAVGAGSASAAIRVVDNSPASVCNNNGKGASPYQTIQSAIDDSAANDTVVVCPGIYQEQVYIDKDGIKLQSNTTFGATIRAPQQVNNLSSSEYGTDAIVTVDAAKNVGITKFVIQGPIYNQQASAGAGVFVTGGATNARIVKNRVLNIYKSYQTEYAGIGILFGDPQLCSCQTISSEAGDTGSGIAQDNQVQGYDLAGVVATNSGSVVNFTRNVVTGDGTDAWYPQTGLAVVDAAQGTLLANKASENTFGGQIMMRDTMPPDEEFSGAGVALYGAAPGTVLTSNIAFANDVGIAVVGGTYGATLKTNTAKGGQYGIFNDNSSGLNQFQANKAQDNSVIDCQDISMGSGTDGTANIWKSNRGTLAEPAGICKP